MKYRDRLVIVLIDVYGDLMLTYSIVMWKVKTLTQGTSNGRFQGGGRGGGKGEDIYINDGADVNTIF